MNNIGQQDGQETLSEMHNREVKAFESQLERATAESTHLVALAGRSFATAKIYEAAAFALRVGTAIGGIAAIRAVVKWW